MVYKRPRATSPSGLHKRSRGAATAKPRVKLGKELEDDGEDAFVPEWKQTVTDERGRRRLHGAFTGGFSAGYFNTVGSKEGWAPSTFVSSRSNRKKNNPGAIGQRPEDFMDEEDLAEAAQSRQLEAAQSFAAVGNAQSENQDVFFGLFTASEQTLGVRFGQRLGWRRGQGVGPKVHRAAHLDDDNDSRATTASSKHLFAPRDSRPISYSRGDRRKGFSFQSEARLSKMDQDVESSSSLADLFVERSSKFQIPKNGAPKKSSFGVGVLNDTGSDDEDPYELGPKIKFNRSIGKDKKPKKPSKLATPATRERHVFVSKKTSTKISSSLAIMSQNGTPSLKNFVFAIHVAIQGNKRRYPPPKISPGWEPAKRVAKEVNSREYQFRPILDLMASRFTPGNGTLGNGTLGNGTEGVELLRKPVAKLEDPAEQAASIGMHGGMTQTISDIMASRFTTGNDKAGVELLRKPVAKPEDPAEQAASLGMYGGMTRTVIPFRPAQLLCKRFNVAPPPDR